MNAVNISAIVALIAFAGFLAASESALTYHRLPIERKAEA